MDKKLLNKKIEQLKSSFSVEGSLLIRSDKFTLEEINDLKSKSKCHLSHWLHITDKIWTDDEIGEQIELFYTIQYVPLALYQDYVNNIMLTLEYKDIKEDNKIFKEILYDFLKIPKYTTFNKLFWSEFGSAPFNIDNKFSDRLLIDAKKLYGACGMEEIFNYKFFKIITNL